VIIFGSVRFLSKKVTKPKFFLKKKTETGSNRPVSVRFGSVFLGQKTVQTGLAWFFRFWLGFGLVFPVWLGFFPVWLSFGSVRFFRLFFSGFLGLIGFPVFLLTPTFHPQ
jgi:hypothetical protein